MTLENCYDMLYKVLFQR